MENKNAGKMQILRVNAARKQGLNTNKNKP